MSYYFYNKNGIGDVLLVRLKKFGKTTSTKDISSIVTVLYQEQEVIGYNFFNISSSIKLNYEGRIMNPKKDHEFVSFIDQCNMFLRLRDETLPLMTFEDSSGFVIGKVLTCQNHESSSHLHVCEVDVKDKILQIVCGASNVKQDALVVVALDGCVMNDGSIIQDGEVLGVKSYGMLCSKRELGLTKNPERVGLLILDEKYSVGHDFFEIEV